MMIRQALPEEYETVRSFYHSVIDAMENAEYKPAWQKDVYPDPEFLRSSVENGELYIGFEGGRIMAAMVLNHNCNDGYEKLSWEIRAERNDVLLIHALCIHPDFGGRGLGKELVRYAQELAGSTGMKAMRLDVLTGNLPAERLYPACGFKYLGTVNMFYEDTGWVDFLLYEYEVKA